VEGVGNVCSICVATWFCFSGGRFIGSKEYQWQEIHPAVREDGKIYISVTAGM